MKTIILTCDQCGGDGHEAVEPSRVCLDYLKGEVKKAKGRRSDSLQDLIDSYRKPAGAQPIWPYNYQNPQRFLDRPNFTYGTSYGPDMGGGVNA